MRINQNLFINGRLRLGSGYPTDVKWHPLYAEDEGYHFLAASYSTGEIKLFLVNKKDGGKGVELEHERNYVSDNYSECGCLDWSPDGHYIVAGYGDGSLKMFDVYTDEMMVGFYGNGHKGEVFSLSHSPDGRFVVSGSYDKTIKLWDTTTGKEVNGFNVQGHSSSVVSVSFSHDGSLIVSGAWDNTLKLWDATIGKEVIGFDGKGHSGEVESVSFSHDSSLIVSGSYDHTLKLWDTITGKEISSYVQIEVVSSVHFSHANKFIVFSSGSAVKLYNVATGTEVSKFNSKGHTKLVTSVRYSPDDRFIVSSSHDQKIKLWDATNGNEVSSYVGSVHTEYFDSVCFSPDERFILSSSNDKILKLRYTNTFKDVVSFNGCGNDFDDSCVKFSPDGEFIIIKSYHQYGTIKLLDATTGQERKKIATKYTTDLNISPDGRFIAYILEYKTLKLWNTTTGNDVTDFNCLGHTGKVFTLSFSLDGRFIVSGSKEAESGSGEGTLKKWNLITGNEVGSFDCKGHPGGVLKVKFSPDGRFIVSGSHWNEGIKLWDATTGKEVNSFDGKSRTNTVNFSPDGCFIVSAGYEDNTIKLWNVTTGKEINTFNGKGHASYVKSLTFSLDGRFIISGSYDHSILIWNLEQMLGDSWLKEHLNTPLILTGVWFPDESRQYMKETKQGNIVDNRPIARCGECGLFFPVEDKMLGKELRCPNETERGKCNRLVKLNEFTAGVER